VNSFVQERLGGISVIKAFGAFSSTDRDFQKPNDKYLQAGLTEVRTFAAFRPLVEVAYIAAVLLVLWAGSWEAGVGGIELGVIVAFLRYIEKFFGPIKDIADKYNLLQSALAAAERIQPMLSEPERLLPQAAPLQRFPAAAIEFEDVWFSYEDDVWVLSGVTFKVPAGKFFGIVGSSGSGKTSLLNLLLRFYEPQRGRILIDGTDIKEIPLSTLRHRIAIVFQDVHIFKGSVAENISLHDPHISAEKIKAAAQEAHLDYFISKLPQGYDTQAGYLGSSLSAGQRQLLSFARALATEADVLILDEATSSIDSHTENKVQHTVINAAANRTLLAVAHRLSTVVEADCILVMYRGRISESGTHKQLMELGKQYFRLYNNQ
jgi:ABC-type multidrug transport system fused ATPase/permease subunit